MRNRTTSIIAGAVALAGSVAGSATALPAFTTSPKTRTVSPTAPQATLTRVTVGRNATFDRIVFRFTGSTPGYRVEYVPTVIQDGSGLPLTLLGRRFLQIRFEPTVNGSSANAPAMITPRFPTLRQVKRAGDFEGVITFGAGLSKRAGFRVFTLTSPRRIVVDVAH